jgi:hypothetical protein
MPDKIHIYQIQEPSPTEEFIGFEVLTAVSTKMAAFEEFMFKRFLICVHLKKYWWLSHKQVHTFRKLGCVVIRWLPHYHFCASLCDTFMSYFFKCVTTYRVYHLKQNPTTITKIESEVCPLLCNRLSQPSLVLSWAELSPQRKLSSQKRNQTLGKGLETWVVAACKTKHYRVEDYHTK